MLPSYLAVLFLGVAPLPGVLAVPQSTPLALQVAQPAAPMLSSPQRLSASGVLVVDAISGQKLFGRQMDTMRPMASLTKLMTALIIAEHHDLSELVTIPPSVEQVKGSKIFVPVGDHFTVGDLLTAMLVGSANDAAESLAIHHSGTKAVFVEIMNARARSLGLSSTSYANPTGLDAPNQWSTPADIAGLTAFAYRMPAIRDRMAMTSARIVSREGRSLSFTHTHELVRGPSTVIAGKTGTTIGAKECLVSIVEEGGRRYIVVLLDSLRRYDDMRRILSYLEPSRAPMIAPTHAAPQYVRTGGG